MTCSKPFYWRKLGKVFTPQSTQGRPWLKEFAQAPATLIFDDFVRVYFSCRPQPDSDGQYISYSAWVDLDRLNLFKILDIAESPILSLGDVGQFDEFGTYPISMTRNNNQIWAYYGGWTRCESVPFNVAIGAAVSYDKGKSFRKLGTGPVLSYSPNEPFILSGPKIRRFNGNWQLFYIAGRKWKLIDNRPEPVYKIRMAISNDGLNWTRLNRDLIPSILEEDEAQASPDVFYCNNKYHMFFCYRYSSDYRNKSRGYRIGYASSSDMIRWERDDSKCGMTVSDNGWDDEMVSYPHLFELDGKIYMAYLGNQVGKYGFGLAVLEGDLV
jgi:hypothetical protein